MDYFGINLPNMTPSCFFDNSNAPSILSIPPFKINVISGYLDLIFETKS
jgi:hypothetical protein